MLRIFNTNEKKISFSGWKEWASSKKQDVLSQIEIEIENHDNAHYDEKFAEKFIEEIRHLPMWTNIFNKKFDLSHQQPSSSASVECEIKKIKNRQNY